MNTFLKIPIKAIFVFLLLAINLVVGYIFFRIHKQTLQVNKRPNRQSELANRSNSFIANTAINEI